MIEPSSPQSSPGLPPPDFSPPPNAVNPPVPRGTRGLIQAVRAEQRRQLWLRGALAAAGITAVLLLAAGLLANLSVGLGRAALLAIPVGVAAALLYFGLYRARRVVGDDRLTARLIGQRVPEVSLDLLAAVELRGELDASPGFSTQLVEAFLRSEDQRANLLTVEQVVDRRPTRWMLQGLAALLLVAVVAWALTLRSWTAGMRAALQTRETPAVAQAREPITGDIEISYRYPAYTGLQPRSIAGTSGEITAPAGTEVILKTRSDREVERAELSVVGQAVPLEIQGGRELTGSLVVEKPGSYSFVFRNARGKELARGPDTAIQVEVDQAPKVNIRTPGQQTEIDPGQKVSLAYDASDDYGIVSLELVYRLPGKSEETRVALPRDEGRRVKGQYTWTLPQNLVSPGDRIQYRLEGKDNDAVAGAKIGASRTQVLTIYSPAAHRRAAMEKAEQLWERLVGLLADRLEGPDREEPKDPKQVETHAQVDRSAQSLVGELRLTAEEIARQRDAPPELWTALVHIADRLRARVQTTADARRTFLRYVSLEVPDSAAARRLTSASDKEVAGLEKDVLYLESLIDRQKLEELKDLAQQLADERRELSSLVDEYQKTQNPNLREDVLRQIQEVRTRMNELMQRMSELQRGIRDEHLNAEALQEMMQQQNMGDALDEIEKLMREGKTEEALKKLQQLDMQMDEMMNALEQGSEEFGDQDYSELQQAFSEFMEDLQKTRAEQQKLANETKSLRDRYRDQQRDRLKRRGDQLKDQLIKEATALQKQYQGVSGDELSSDAAQPLEDVQEQLENLKSALEVEDFDLAAEAAAQAARSSDNLSSQAERQRRLDEMFERPQVMRQQSKQLSEQLTKDADRVQEINRKLQEMFPPPSEAISEADQKQLKELKDQQRKLQQRAQELGEQMQQMQQMAPVFGQEASDQMGQVSERMGEAAEQLDGRDARRGYSEQKNALDAMERFQQQMQQQQQQGQGKRGGIPLPMFAGPRGSSSGNRQQQDKVEIPDENQFQAPKEFRKDLLDAMKEGTPDKYKDQVKRYYEELVK